MVKFQGGDVWFLLYRFLPLHTLPFSFLLLYLIVPSLYLDYKGTKDKQEKKKEEEEQKKYSEKQEERWKQRHLIHSSEGWVAKPFEPPVKPQHRLNFLFLFRMMVEASFFAALMFALLPQLSAHLLEVLFPFEQLTPPRPRALTDYQTSIMQCIAIAFGSAVFEELIFRYGLLKYLTRLLGKRMPKREKALWGMVDVPKKRVGIEIRISAVLLCALIYAVSHFLIFPVLNPNAELFTAYTLLYRTLYGVVMSYVMIWRKSGVAVMTHCFYELFYFFLV